jgi:exonuclease III
METMAFRIATWNVERLKHKNQMSALVSACEQAVADILILTETDTRLAPHYKHCFSTLTLTDKTYYKETERRVSVYANCDFIRQYSTYDDCTALCVELQTECGNLLVYGTIVGIYGNRHPSFMQDLTQQTADIERFVRENKPICFIGDYNCTFADSYYFTSAGRTAFSAMFQRGNLELLTRNQAECIDHIAISRDFVQNSRIDIAEWNLDKKLSDHKGIVVEMK